MRFLFANRTVWFALTFGLAGGLAGAPMAMAAPAAGTVNAYSPAQERHAEAAARAKGYSGLEVTMAQAGNLFLKGEKGGKTFMLTVTPDGKVYPSTPVGGG